MLIKESQSRQENNKTHAEKRKREERNTGVIFQVISGGGGGELCKKRDIYANCIFLSVLRTTLSYLQLGNTRKKRSW